MDRYGIAFGMTLMLPTLGVGQALDPALITELPPALGEASAILRHGEHTWLALDSGNPNVLYRVDPLSGQVVQEVMLTNATNVDWEEVATDGAWVFVGDIGNNAGHRTDLCFYRFPIQELSEGTDQVVVDTIRFHYADQLDHTPAPDATNWDCEAFLALDDSLFLFTKNWLDERTHVYALPALPGAHTAVRRAVFDSQGLVTGAAHDPNSGDIALIGHTAQDVAPFVWVLRGYSGHHFFEGTSQQHSITMVPLQAEALAYTGASTLMVANEWSPEQAPALWHLQLPMSVRDDHSRKVLRAFPVPADREVHVEGADGTRPAQVFGLNGAWITTVNVRADGTIQLPALTNGEYLLEVINEGIPQRIPLVVSH